eukprot:7036891-Alexandrium_andersonii.AAC.1
MAVRSRLGNPTPSDQNAHHGVGPGSSLRWPRARAAGDSYVLLSQPRWPTDTQCERVRTVNA